MNAKSGSGGSGTFIWGLVAGLVVVLVAGGLYLSGLFDRPQELAEPESVETSEPNVTAKQEAEEPADIQPEEQTTEASEPAPATPVESTEQAAVIEEEQVQEREEPETPVLAAPVLDQIFVEPDGNGLLSGSAEPGAEVNVLLDGETIHRFVVDASGQFAEFVSIPFGDDARGLVLETRSGENTSRSDDYLIAALPEPVSPVESEPSADEPVKEVAEAQTVVTETNDQQAADEAETEENEPEVAGTVTPPADQAAPATETQSETVDVPDQQVAILRSGEEGVELVQPPTVLDTPPEQIALDTIGYSDVGDVELTGRAQDGSAVRLYLDNKLVADLEPATDGQWRGEVEGIDPGVYTLRVDEVAPDGTVVSRLETPFKREPVEALRAAETTEAGETPAGTPAIRSVTVQKGDTLWAISRDRFGDGVLYVKLFEANKDSIRDPDLIYPGQIFTIPE